MRNRDVVDEGDEGEEGEELANQAQCFMPITVILKPAVLVNRWLLHPVNLEKPQTLLGRRPGLFNEPRCGI
jgi:hypothetical protein